MVNTFANDYDHLQTIFAALRKASIAQQDAVVEHVWLAAVQLSVISLRRLYEAVTELENHIKVWKRRVYEEGPPSRSTGNKWKRVTSSQLESLRAPFQKVEVLKWLQRVYLSSFAQVQSVVGDLLLSDYFQGKRATHYLLCCSQPDQSKVLVQAAAGAAGHVCTNIRKVLLNLEQEVATILSKPCEELAGLHTAVLSVLLKRKILGTGFRPVFEDSQTADQQSLNYSLDAALQAAEKLQAQLGVDTVLEGLPKPAAPAGPTAEEGAAGTSQPAPVTVTQNQPKKLIPTKKAICRAGGQVDKRHLLQLPPILVPDNRRLRRARRVGLVLGCAWLLRHAVRVARLGLGVTKTVVVPTAAIRLPMKLKSLRSKAPIVDPQRLERDKAQLQEMEKELRMFGRKLEQESKQDGGTPDQKINLGTAPVDIESDDDAELLMMHALHGASEAVEDNFLSKMNALSSLHPGHILKVLSFLVKRTKIQAQDMLLRLDNIARTNNLILSLLTALPPLAVSLLIHWCITRRLIWVNARPGSNFLLTLHAQMHVVGNALKAWLADPERTDLHGAFLYELAKATRICLKMVNRSRGVCHETLVSLLFEDMIKFSKPGTPADKLAQFDALMSNNPLLKDSA